MEVAVLHFGRQTHSHEEDKSLFEIWERATRPDTHTHTHTHSVCTQVLLSHYIITEPLKVLAVSEAMRFATGHMFIYYKFLYF